MSIDKATQFHRLLAQNQLEVGVRGLTNDTAVFAGTRAIGLFFSIIRRSDRWYRNENGSVAGVDPRYYYARLLSLRLASPRLVGQEELHNFVARLWPFLSAVSRNRTTVKIAARLLKFLRLENHRSIAIAAKETFTKLSVHVRKINQETIDKYSSFTSKRLSVGISYETRALLQLLVFSNIPYFQRLSKIIYR